MTSVSDIRKRYNNRVDQIDIDLVIAHILKHNREFILTHPEKILTVTQQAKIYRLLERREKNEPLAYLLGQKEFYGLTFNVNSSTLIPRPETELLVEKSLQLLEENMNKRFSIIDVGTGSGNIIISLADNCRSENHSYYASDISQGALRIAKQNAEKHLLIERINFFHSDLLVNFINQKRDFQPDEILLIIANLPYLSEMIYTNTMPDVKNYEPRTALLSKEDGLSHYRRLFSQAGKLFEKYETVCLIFEFSPEQKKSLGLLIGKILPTAKCQYAKDLAGRWRICQIRLNR